MQALSLTELLNSTAGIDQPDGLAGRLILIAVLAPLWVRNVEHKLSSVHTHAQALNLTELLNSTAGINLTGVPLVANISLSGRNRTVITASAVAAATAAAGGLAAAHIQPSTNATAVKWYCHGVLSAGLLPNRMKFVAWWHCCTQQAAVCGARDMQLVESASLCS